jgi:CHAT domain-containing protein
VEGLAHVIGAATLKAEAASLAGFLDQARDYRILHLATHGVANIHRGEYSFLAFSLSEEDREGRLYVEDLYQMDLPAEMVVMSACESGIGRFQAGEGAISLGRGFARAGARSLIVTLWSVNDAKTADFMQAFYRELKAGSGKDMAIWQVQQDYLQQAGHAEAHPFYWAAFLPIGDMEPLEVQSAWNGWQMGAFLLLIAGLGWWLRSRFLKNLSK